MSSFAVKTLNIVQEDELILLPLWMFTDWLSDSPSGKLTLFVSVQTFWLKLHLSAFPKLHFSSPKGWETACFQPFVSLSLCLWMPQSYSSLSLCMSVYFLCVRSILAEGIRCSPTSSPWHLPQRSRDAIRRQKDSRRSWGGWCEGRKSREYERGDSKVGDRWREGQNHWTKSGVRD